MTISYQKVNLVVFIVLAVANDGTTGSATQQGPTTTAGAPAWQDQTAAAGACPVKYAAPETQTYPLLFGGVEESCTSGCQPRNGSPWNKVCKRDKLKPAWGMCLPQQRQQLLTFVKEQVQQGAADASILSLSPCRLHDLLSTEGRTLWLIGDSHIKQIYAALRCFMTDFWAHSQGECAASPEEALQFQLDDVTAAEQPYRTPPRCLHLKGGSGARICLVHSPKGDMFLDGNPEGIGTLQLLAKSLVAPQDIMYISVGRWHASNCDGVGSKFASILDGIGRFAQENAATIPNIFFSPSPFDHVACGADNKPLLAPSGSCVPYTEGHYSLGVWQQVVQMSREVLGQQYRVPLIDTFRWTVPLHFAHIPLAGNGWDCLHYCRPGLSEVEVWHMVTAMQTRGLKTGTASNNAGAHAAAERQCAPLVKRADRDYPVDPLDPDEGGQLLPPTDQIA